MNRALFSFLLMHMDLRTLQKPLSHLGSILRVSPIPKSSNSDPNPIQNLSLSSPFLIFQSCWDMENMYSWVRKSLSRPIKIKSFSKNKTTHQSILQENEELYGVNDELIDLISSFTLDTFRNYPLQGLNFLYIHTFMLVYVFLGV